MNLKKPDFDVSEVKVPQVVQDLYADLRDRKLLPIVGILLVAIVAVPILLSSSSGSTPNVTEAPPAEIVAAPEAAVRRARRGARPPRLPQRLDALKAKNPFDQQFTDASRRRSPRSPTTAAAGSAPTDTGSVSDLRRARARPRRRPARRLDGDGGRRVTDDTTATATRPSTRAPTEPSSSPSASICFGPEGDVKEHKNVKLLDVLEPGAARSSAAPRRAARLCSRSRTTSRPSPARASARRTRATASSSPQGGQTAGTHLPARRHAGPGVYSSRSTRSGSSRSRARTSRASSATSSTRRRPLL